MSRNSHLSTQTNGGICPNGFVYHCVPYCTEDPPYPESSSNIKKYKHHQTSSNSIIIIIIIITLMLFDPTCSPLCPRTNAFLQLCMAFPNGNTSQHVSAKMDPQTKPRHDFLKLLLLMAQFWLTSSPMFIPSFPVFFWENYIQGDSNSAINSQWEPPRHRMQGRQNLYQKTDDSII